MMKDIQKSMNYSIYFNNEIPNGTALCDCGRFFALIL